MLLTQPVSSDENHEFVCDITALASWDLTFNGVQSNIHSFEVNENPLARRSSFSLSFLYCVLLMKSVMKSHIHKRLLITFVPKDFT